MSKSDKKDPVNPQPGSDPSKYPESPYKKPKKTPVTEEDQEYTTADTGHGDPPPKDKEG